MNVTCDKCNKRYSIADDKVRGKSVKIRCKQCQNLISVQGPGAGAAAAPVRASSMPSITANAAAAGGVAESPWAEERTRAMPAVDFSATWYAMVKGTQVGPLSLKDLEMRVKSGEVSLRTYLWKQGMADWKRASDVPDVSMVFAGVSVGASATGPVTAATPTSPERPASKSRAAVQRDVATANELPSPELTSRPSSPRITNGNGNGNGHGLGTLQAEAGQAEDEARTVVAPNPHANQSGPAAKIATASQPSHRPSTGSQSGARVAVPAAAPAARPATGSQSGVRASGGSLKSASVPAAAPVAVQARPQPEPDRAAQAAQQAPLNDLFTDTDLPSSGTHRKPDGEDGETDPRADGTESPSMKNAVDPFAALGAADPSQEPPPGEATKFFIAQAGVNKRNPPWKIALFLVLMFGLPAGALYLLSSLHIVQLEVKHTNENGEVVTQSIFSGDGVAGLKDLLTGEEKKRRELAAKKAAEAKDRADAERRARDKQPVGQQVAAADPTAVPDRKDGTKPQYTPEELKKLYGLGGNSTGSPVDLETLKGGDVKVKVRPVFEDKPVVSEGGGLSPKVVAETVGKSQAAFQNCIEQALHKNPNLKVGKVTVKVDVGVSGAVKSSSIEPKAHELSDWGGCIKDRARRMVFPASSNDEETSVEIPLVVGVSMQ